MPLISGLDLTNVKAQDELLPPGEYECKVIEVDYDSDKDSHLIVSAVDDGGDQNGRRIYDRVYMRKNDGGRNEFGEKQLRRYFEAALGEEYDFTAPNTDDLLNQRIVITTKIRSYKKDGEDRQSLDVKNVLPVR